MAKTLSTYPTTIDSTLQTDRASGDIVTSDSYDVIEDAIYKLETKVGTGAALSASDSDKLDGNHSSAFLLTGGTAVSASDSARLSGLLSTAFLASGGTAVSASDSDKLDGYHYQSFLLSGGNALTCTSASNADTLDTLHATSFALSADVVVGVSTTNTLTNKRITPRVLTATASATPVINTDNCDCVTFASLNVAITSMTTGLTGTPNNFDKLIFRIKDNGTAHAITWGASFVAKGVALPTTTVISKLLTVGFIYDTVAASWGCVASSQEA